MDTLEGAIERIGLPEAIVRVAATAVFTRHLPR